jgi:putative sterol carrier protein
MCPGRIFAELCRIVEKAKGNKRCMEALADVKEKTILIQATDTGEKCYFMVKNGAILGPFEGEPSQISMMVEGREDVLLDIWAGRLDPDAAFFFRKVKVKGSFHDAMKLKNLFEIVGNKSTS